MRGGGRCTAARRRRRPQVAWLAALVDEPQEASAHDLQGVDLRLLRLDLLLQLRDACLGVQRGGGGVVAAHDGFDALLEPLLRTPDVLQQHGDACPRIRAPVAALRRRSRRRRGPRTRALLCEHLVRASEHDRGQHAVEVRAVHQVPLVVPAHGGPHQPVVLRQQAVLQLPQEEQDPPHALRVDGVDVEAAQRRALDGVRRRVRHLAEARTRHQELVRLHLVRVQGVVVDLPHGGRRRRRSFGEGDFDERFAGEEAALLGEAQLRAEDDKRAFAPGAAVPQVCVGHDPDLFRPMYTVPLAQARQLLFTAVHLSLAGGGGRLCCLDGGSAGGGAPGTRNGGEVKATTRSAGALAPGHQDGQQVVLCTTQHHERALWLVSNEVQIL
eukprot:Rhum_TRINITY_DN14535_c13_g1::Rhum_TRINITY_DN14535_c13_g1_i1::g.98364::m.98364